MSTDLIDPSAIFIPKVQPDALEEAAADIRNQGGKIAQSGQDIKSSWAGLSSCYSAPEDGTLLSVVDPVAVTGDDVDSDLGEVATALETFAETARDLKAKLQQAQDDAEAFRESIKGDDEWDDASGMFGDTSEKAEEHNDLLNRVATLTHQYREAERECANKITSLFEGGTTFIGGAADGSTEPGAGEKVYGTKKPLTDVPTPWGTPQGSDFPFWVEWGVGGANVTVGAFEDMGGQIGLHSEDGWGVSSPAEWRGNVASYWGDSLLGAAAMVGAWNPKSGTWTKNGQEFGVAKTAWANAAHGFFPWTEMDERPGYAIGTGVQNVSYMVGGAALSFIPLVGPYAAAGATGSRVARIFGGVGDGNGPFGGGGHGGDGGDGSGYDGSGGRFPTSRPGGAPGEVPDKFGPDGGFDLSGIGDMNESLGDLEASQRPAPRWQPEPAPDYAPDPDPAPDPPTRPEPETSQESDHAPQSVPDQQEAPEPESTPERPSEQDSSRLDPTAEEVDENFAELARRNEDLGNTMDAEDGGRMAELDGEDPWSIEALKDPEGDAGRDGPDDEDARVPVTPDGMEMSHHEPGDGNEGSGGPSAEPQQSDTGEVEVTEDHRPVGDPRSGGKDGPAVGGGAGGPGGGGTPGSVSPGDPNASVRPTKEAGDGPMEAGQESRLRDLLQAQGFPKKKIDKVIANLSNPETEVGHQIADIATNNEVKEVKRFGELMSAFAKNSPKDALSMGAELRFLDGLLDKGYSSSKVESGDGGYWGKQYGISREEYDIDAQIKTNGGTTWAYQIKRVGFGEQIDFPTEQAIKREAWRVQNKLRRLSVASEIKTHGILEINAEKRDLNEDTMQDLKGLVNSSGVPLKIYFSDGVLTIPPDAQFYPDIPVSEG